MQCSRPGSRTPVRRLATPLATARRLVGGALLLSVLLAAVAAHVPVVHAEPRAAISPARLVIAEPLRTGAGRDLPPLTITNDGSTAARFRLVILSVDDGQSRPLEPGWLGPALDPFDLAAGASRTVTLHLTVPADATGGVYQGLLAVRIEGAPLTTGSVATVLQFAVAVSQGDSPLQRLVQSAGDRALPLGAIALVLALAGAAYALRARLHRPQLHAGVTVRRPRTIVAEPVTAAEEFTPNVTVNPEPGEPAEPGAAAFTTPSYTPPAHVPSNAPPSAQPARPLPPLPSMSAASPSSTSPAPTMRQPTVPPIPTPNYPDVSLHTVLETAPGGVAGALGAVAAITVVIVTLTAAATWWAAMRFDDARGERLTRVEERLAALAADPAAPALATPTPRAPVPTTPSPSPSPTPTRTPTPVPSPTRTATSPPTATRTPAAAPAAIPTATATPGRTFPQTLFGKPVFTNGRDLWNCADFQTWEQAQMVYEANLPGDPNLIDSDRNGIACEALRAREQQR